MDVVKIGVIVEIDSFVIMCIDNSLRLADGAKYKKLYPYLANGDYVVIEDGENYLVQNLIPINEFKYYENVFNLKESVKFNYLYVPKVLLDDKNNFFIDYGENFQFVCCYRDKEVLCAKSFKLVGEDEIVRSHFKNFKNPSDDELWNTIEQIETYIDNLDVDQILNSFTIENKEIFITRPGKDDYYYVQKVDSIINEPYIKTLFPSRSTQIYKDSGFCTAHSMSIDPSKREYFEEETKFINEAKQKYDKELHRKFLICQYINLIVNTQKKLYKKEISNYNQYRAFLSDILCYCDSENFVTRHNHLLEYAYNERF